MKLDRTFEEVVKSSMTDSSLAYEKMNEEIGDITDVALLKIMKEEEEHLPNVSLEITPQIPISSSLALIDSKDDLIKKKQQQTKLQKVFKTLSHAKHYNITSNPLWSRDKTRKSRTSRAALKASQITDRNTQPNKFIDGHELATLFQGVTLQRSTLGRKAGLGLFAERVYKRNEIVTEFVGWIISRSEASRLREKNKGSHIVSLEYQHSYIDGIQEPDCGIGGGSFANDGSFYLGGPGNNCTYRRIYDMQQARKRIFLVATREIQNGEEIFVSYDRDYWLYTHQSHLLKKRKSKREVEAERLLLLPPPLPTDEDHVEVVISENEEFND